jgi:hypothetical protein
MPGFRVCGFTPMPASVRRQVGVLNLAAMVYPTPLSLGVAGPPRARVLGAE